MTTAAPNNSRPLVHGYLRREEPDETEIAVLCKDLGTFCALNGYRLGSVFIDRGVPDDVFARTGFTSLLNAIHLTQAQAVVVPTLEHLSAQAFIRNALTRMVTATGSRVLVAYQANGSGQGTEIGLGCKPEPGAGS